MGQHIQLTSEDQHTFSAYQALPEQECIGSVVILQEIFGVNAHIREVVDGYAIQGYAAVAPALFDRIEKDVELEYNEDGISTGLALARQKLSADDALTDISIAVNHIAEQGKVATIGYCFGGFLSYLAACKIEALSCAIAYYGGGIASVLEQTPQRPIQFHFAEHDNSIPLSDVELVKAAVPNAPCYTYPADHGFNCNHRGAWHAESAQVALERTLEFMQQHQQ